MTSATEKLRALLDERGEKHYDGTCCTLWAHVPVEGTRGVYRVSAFETSDGYMQVDMMHVTPEQAIEATLGRGTCRMETAEGCQNWCSCSVCNADWYTDQPVNYCPNCGARVMELDE